MTYELHTSRYGIDVLAFNCSDDYTALYLEGELELVSSDKPHVLDFISTKVNSSFSVNKAALELFLNLGDDLKELENKVCIYMCMFVISKSQDQDQDQVKSEFSKN